jgi:hypothetical protein
MTTIYMASLTALIERETDKLPLQQQHVRSIVKGTCEPNGKLHEKWALGFQEWLILKELADSSAHQIDSKLHCRLVRASFHHPVPVDSEIRVSKPEPISTEKYQKEGHRYPVGFSIDIYVNDQHAANGIFLYNKGGHKIIQASQGHLYELTRKRAKQTAFGLYKKGEDYAAQALGLASNALFQDGRQIVKSKKQENPPKVPIYIAHVLNLTPELEHLKDRDRIRVKTNALELAQRHSFDAKKDRYMVSVSSTTDEGKHGRLLYEGNLVVAFKNPEEAQKPQ